MPCLGWRDYSRKVSTRIESAYRSGETKTRVQTGKILCSAQGLWTVDFWTHRDCTFVTCSLSEWLCKEMKVILRLIGIVKKYPKFSVSGKEQCQWRFSLRLLGCKASKRASFSSRLSKCNIPMCFGCKGNTLIRFYSEKMKTQDMLQHDPVTGNTRNVQRSGPWSRCNSVSSLLRERFDKFWQGEIWFYWWPTSFTQFHCNLQYSYFSSECEVEANELEKNEWEAWVAG